MVDTIYSPTPGDDSNLKNLYHAMQYSPDGYPELRTASRIEIDAISNINVSVGSSVEVSNFPNVQYVVGDANVILADSAQNSAFSRLRTSSTTLLGEFRTFYGTTGNTEIVTHTVGSGTASGNLTTKYTTLSVSSANGDQVVRQTRQYHPYIPGTSTIGMLTFCFSQTKANLQQCVGMNDDNDGIFLRMAGAVAQFVVRKNGFDSEVINQSNWNVDAFDGTGPSGVVIDWTKAQILVIDYQWLGVGRVRVGFSVEGQVRYAHYFGHLNAVNEPYMTQPSLPARWELKNTGLTSGSSSMKAICYGVYSEGSLTETGFINSASNGVTHKTINSGSGVGMLAVRLKNSVNGIPVKALARIRNWNIITDQDIFYKVLLLQGSSALSGTPTWTSATPTGWCEYTTSFSLGSDPGVNSIVLYQGYAQGGAKNAGGGSTIMNTFERSAAIYQNYDSTDSMIIAVVGYQLSSVATAYAALEWIEIK